MLVETMRRDLLKEPLSFLRLSRGASISACTLLLGRTSCAPVRFDAMCSCAQPRERDYTLQESETAEKGTRKRSGDGRTRSSQGSAECSRTRTHSRPRRLVGQG